jgi:hypothetical protein
MFVTRQMRIFAFAAANFRIRICENSHSQLRKLALRLPYLILLGELDEINGYIILLIRTIPSFFYLVYLLLLLAVLQLCTLVSSFPDK